MYESTLTEFSNFSVCWRRWQVSRQFRCEKEHYEKNDNWHLSKTCLTIKQNCTKIVKNNDDNDSDSYNDNDNNNDKGNDNYIRIMIIITFYQVV